MKTASNQIGLITNVNRTTLQYLWHYQRAEFIIYTALAVIPAVILFSITQNVYAFGFPLFPYIYWLYKIRNLVQSQFIRQFAAANHLQYTSMGAPNRQDGRPFHLGVTSSSSNIVSGQLHDRPFQLFLYSYITGEGRDSRSHSLTIMTVELGRTVPNIYAVCLDQTGKNREPLGLPAPNYHAGLIFNNDFDEYYRLETDENEQIEALQIFEPSLLESIINLPYRFHFELRQDTLYIYASGSVDTKAELDSMFTFAEEISSRILREIRTMHTTQDVAAIGAPARQKLGSAFVELITFFLNAFTYIFLFTGTACTLLIPLQIITIDTIPINERFTLAGINFLTGLTVFSIGALLWRLRRKK